jgi:hypothetical protein
MTGIVIAGILKELEKLFENTGTSVLFDTQFDEVDMPVHTLPCAVLQLSDSPDSEQSIGGATQYQWDWIITVYELITNAEYSPDQGYSTSLIDIIDTVRKHFAKKIWLSQEFIDLATLYSFNMNLNGLTKGQRMKSGNGTIMSFNIHYNSTAIDADTSHTQLSDYPLQKTVLDSVSFK